MKEVEQMLSLNKSECRFNNGKKEDIISSSHAWIIPTQKTEQTSIKSYMWTDYNLVSAK